MKISISYRPGRYISLCILYGDVIDIIFLANFKELQINKIATEGVFPQSVQRCMMEKRWKF